PTMAAGTQPAPAPRRPWPSPRRPARMRSGASLRCWSKRRPRPVAPSRARRTLMPRSREDRIEVAGLTITGIAEGGVETNVRVPELKLMFDIGMCPPHALKLRRLLVSHGPADHLGGLHYFLPPR